MIDDLGELYDDEKEGGDKRNIDLGPTVKRHVDDLTSASNVDQKQTSSKRLKIDDNNVE